MNIRLPRYLYDTVFKARKEPFMRTVPRFLTLLVTAIVLLSFLGCAEKEEQTEAEDVNTAVKAPNDV
jgi:hypothetical protein